MDISKAIKNPWKTTFRAPAQGGFYIKPELYFLRTQDEGNGVLSEVSVTEQLTPLYVNPGQKLVISCDGDQVTIEVS
jgi:hypothetical protein